MEKVKILTIILGATLVIGVVTTNISKTKVFAAVNNLTLTGAVSKGVSEYKELTPQTVDKNKIFTITFNKALNKSTINRNTIKVLDSKGQEVSITIPITMIPNNKVVVSYPSGGYTEGLTYTLIIKQGIVDIDNLKLAEDVSMKFTIKSSVVVVPPPIVPSVFIRKDISSICNYGDFKVNGEDIILKDYNDFEKKVKPSYTLDSTYNSKLKTDVYSIANAIINPLMYTTLGYSTDYNRVVIEYSKTANPSITDFAFAYALYTDKTPYIESQQLPHFIGLKPLGKVYMGMQFLDDASINSFYKTNKILFGEQGDDISDDIVNNYKLHSNTSHGFGYGKNFGNIRIEANYSKNSTTISFYEIM
ncbi:Ig-like domain-containing protein [Clostridium estertheticum]|uniref:Ig-like domain-containing protein n=1 Tax=Clostridium estertheticum TaxID=238834 RepID=UPI001C0C0F8E|nr:Ig-like domain-containing protein [Clostridium estertheticum]MBU3173300.1 Ig-like domain-containing protein [Clostridium estertheticum]